MNTPAHIILSVAVFARPQETGRTLAAVAGAVAPDLSLYLMAGTSLFLLGMAPEYVFGTLYYSDAWQRVFSIDNSIILWGIGFFLSWWFGRRILIAFTASGLMHLMLDLPLHHDDGRPHFWPVSNWIFESPISYWDAAHHAGIVGSVETVLSLLLCVMLLYRFKGFVSRVLISVLAAFQLVPYLIWVVFFAMNVA